MRGLGDYDVFQYNFISGCYAVNVNHDDGFQSWSVGPSGVGTDTVRGMIIRGNTIISYLDSAQPLRGHVQGIGCFDGFCKDWLIENNVVFTDTWHGISLYGAIDCRILNNTVLDENFTTPGPPWIGVFAHKNGTPSRGCIIRNNLATAFNLTGSTSDHNIQIKNSDSAYKAFFVDYTKSNFHLKSSSPAIDSGSADVAPSLDLESIARPQGKQIDIGAYEYNPTSAIQTFQFRSSQELKNLGSKDLTTGLKNRVVYSLAGKKCPNNKIYTSGIVITSHNGRITKTLISSRRN